VLVGITPQKAGVLDIRIFAQPASSYFLFGLRGVGKSTLAKAAFPGFVRFLPIAGICHGQAVNTANIASGRGPRQG
jgi:hypothetical protein